MECVCGGGGGVGREEWKNKKSQVKTEFWICHFLVIRMIENVSSFQASSNYSSRHSFRELRRVGTIVLINWYMI